MLCRYSYSSENGNFLLDLYIRQSHILDVAEVLILWVYLLLIVLHGIPDRVHSAPLYSYFVYIFLLARVSHFNIKWNQTNMVFCGCIYYVRSHNWSWFYKTSSRTKVLSAIIHACSSEYIVQNSFLWMCLFTFWNILFCNNIFHCGTHFLCILTSERSWYMVIMTFYSAWQFSVDTESI